MVDLMQSLKSVVSKFGRDKGDSVLGVDISASTIKLVQLKRVKGQAVLETYGELALGPYAGLEVGQAVKLPPEKVAEALLDLMREAKVTTVDCGIAIPVSSSLVTVITIPTIDESQLKSVVPIEARKYIPVPTSEVFLDWHSIPPRTSEEGGDATNVQKSEVLIVAIHKETIQQYQQIIQQSGLHATFFEIEIFSAVRSVLSDTSEPVVIIDLGTSRTKIYLVEHGIIRSSHSINKGTQDITSALESSLGLSPLEAEQMTRTLDLSGAENPEAGHATSVVFDYIFSEIQRILRVLNSKHDIVIERTIFVGGGAQFKGILEYASKRLSLTTEIGNPFTKVTTPAFLDDMLSKTGAGFAVAVGVALRKLDEKA